MIHGPSLALGAGIAAAALVATFLVVGAASNEPQLAMAPAAGGQDGVTMETYTGNGSPALGDANAPMTLVEFGDYQCHFCNVFFHETEGAILEEYVEAGRARLIFKDFNIIGPDSVLASHAAHCAGDQGSFWEYHDILYENWTGENDGWASEENQRGFASGLGLDVERWSECVKEQRHSAKILASNQDARALGLTGTPAFFIIAPDGNITRVFGAQPYEHFAGILDAELARTGN